MGAKQMLQDAHLREDVRVYLGPTLHKRALVAGSCFRGGLTEYVEELARKLPELSQMIVPLDRAAETRRRAGEPGTEEHRVYRYLKTVRFEANGEVRN